MQFSTLFSAVVAALVGSASVAAAPTINNVESNVAPYVGTSNTNVGNAQGNLGAAVYNAQNNIPRVRRRSSKSSSSPELINSPETVTDASCSGNISLPFWFCLIDY